MIAKKENNEVNKPVQKFNVYCKNPVVDELTYQCYKEYLIDKGEKHRSENRDIILRRYHKKIVRKGYNMTFEQLSDKIGNFDRNKIGAKHRERIKRELQSENENKNSHKNKEDELHEKQSTPENKQETTQEKNKTQHQTKNDQNTHKQIIKEKVQSSDSSDFLSPILPLISPVPSNSPSSDFESSKIKLPVISKSMSFNFFSSTSTSTSHDDQELDFSSQDIHQKVNSSNFPSVSLESTEIDCTQTIIHQQQIPNLFLPSSDLMRQNSNKSENSSGKLLQEIKDQSNEKSMNNNRNNNNNNDDDDEIDI